MSLACESWHDIGSITLGGKLPCVIENRHQHLCQGSLAPLLGRPFQRRARAQIPSQPVVKDEMTKRKREMEIMAISNKSALRSHMLIRSKRSYRILFGNC
jgi:hypothetical protein